MSATFGRFNVPSPGDDITAENYNGEFDNILANLNPQGIGDMSGTLSEYRAVVNPGSTGSESLPTDLYGELARIRYVLKEAFGGTNWYDLPANGTINAPSAMTDNGVAVFDNSTNLLRSSKVVIDDGDNVTIPTTTITTSSANTSYTTTTVVDGVAWDLSEVVVGDVVKADSSEGVITAVNDGTNTVTVSSWVGGTPSNTSVATIERRGSLTLGNNQELTLGTDNNITVGNGSEVNFGSTKVYEISGNNISNVDSTYANAIVSAATNQGLKGYQEYTYDATLPGNGQYWHFYTFPSDVNAIEVTLVGGGGGGGGTSTTASSERSESSGGGGGAVFEAFIEKTDIQLPASQDVNSISSDQIFFADNASYPHGLPVQFTTTGTFPSGITGSTTYYIYNPGQGEANQLMSTQAATSASPISISGGTGTLTMIPQEEYFISFGVASGRAGGSAGNNGLPGIATRFSYYSPSNVDHIYFGLINVNGGVGGELGHDVTNNATAYGGDGGTVTVDSDAATPPFSYREMQGGDGFNGNVIGGDIARLGTGGDNAYAGTSRISAINTTGNDGHFPGGGGSGSSIGGSQSGQAGGDGAPGVAWVKEYY